MEEPVLIPKPKCTQELFRVLTTTEGLVAGLMLCGEPIDVSKIHYGKRKRFVMGLPIMSCSRKFQGGTLERDLWWVVAEDGTSAIMTAPRRGVAGRWVATTGVVQTETRLKYEQPERVGRSITYFLIRKIFTGMLSLEEQSYYVMLLGLVDRLMSGQLVP